MGARNVTITNTYEPDRATRETYDTLYREFRGIYKANKRMYAQLNGGEAR